MHYLWRYFCEISMGLAVNGMAPSVLTWEGLQAWCALKRIELEPWEAGALVRLSCLRIKIRAEQAEADARRKERR